MTKLCPDRDTHTPCPDGYVQWHTWAAKMGKSHRQVRCETCGLYEVWVPKGEHIAATEGTK
jgi:hypothetical protein